MMGLPVRKLSNSRLNTVSKTDGSGLIKESLFRENGIKTQNEKLEDQFTNKLKIGKDNNDIGQHYDNINQSQSSSQ